MTDKSSKTNAAPTNNQESVRVIGRRVVLKITGTAGVAAATSYLLSACGSAGSNNLPGSDSSGAGTDSDSDNNSAGDTSSDGSSTESVMSSDDTSTSDSSSDDSMDEDSGEDSTTDNTNECDPLPVPPLLEGVLVAGVRVFELDLQPGTMEWIPGNPTATYGVNGPFLGPTLHFRRGERVRIEVKNSLDETTTLHWHGMELPAKSDGGPYQPIASGESWSAEFEVKQRAMMAWYHPHQMHVSGRHVYMGMAGLIYVDDPNQTFDLPSTYGVDDVPLVIQDRRFAADGTHPYSDGGVPFMHDRMAGLKGPTMLVNGQIEANYSAHQGIVRFRILNGSNARNYNLGFADNRNFQYIGSDGGLFEAPIMVNRVLLGPGERADILVDFSDDSIASEVLLQSYSGEVFDRLFTGVMGGNLADDLDRSTFPIMTFKVCQPPGTAIVPSNTFDPIEEIPVSAATPTREIAMSMAMAAFRINGTLMDQLDNVPDAINFRIASGQIEIWRVTNTSGMPHPLHIHNRHFQVLDIDGQAPPSYLAGWKDTVLVEPGQEIRLALEFLADADEEFPYMFHCHILEHEDRGMMGQFYIVDESK